MKQIKKQSFLTKKMNQHLNTSNTSKIYESQEFDREEIDENEQVFEEVSDDKEEKVLENGEKSENEKTFLFWRNMENKNYEKYINYCKFGFPDQDLGEKKDLEKGIGNGCYECITRCARARIYDALKRGRAKRRQFVIGAIEPRYFDYFSRLSGGKRSTFTYNKPLDLGESKKVVTIRYKWDAGLNGLPELGISDSWSKKIHKTVDRVGTNTEVTEKRKFKVFKVTLLCNSHTWEVKMKIDWYCKRKLINGKRIGASEKYQFCV
jgi:hypothetical protein